MTDFKVTDEAVEAFKHAYGQNFVDGKLIKVDERIARALEAALLVMFQEAAWLITHPSSPDSPWATQDACIYEGEHRKPLYEIKEPK